MAITSAMCSSFKQELLCGYHNFLAAGDTFKIALIKPSGTLTQGAATINYSQLLTDEVATATGYSQPGIALTSVDPVLDATITTTALCDFADATWSPTVTITAQGALIYNSATKGGSAGRAACVLDFGGPKSSTSGTFTVVFPAPAAATAILRIA